MSTFEASPIPSPFGNVLYDPMGVDQAVRANQRNDLMMAGERQKQAAGGQEQIGRAAAWVAGLPADQQPAAYDAAVRQLNGAGLLPNGAPAYPGAEALRGLAQRTLPVEMQYQLGLITSPALDAALKSIYGPGGAPGGAAPAASGSGAIPSGGGKPFVYPNLPQGVTPDEDQMVRTVYGEARGEPLAGQQAVAHVVQNRVKGGGGSISDVVFAPNQFEPWNNPTTRAQLEALDPNSADYQRILTQAVRPVMAGQAQDPTGGATHFVSPTAQAALGRQMPAWATGSRTTIGLHDFYYPGYSGQPAPQQANGAPATPAPYRVAGPTVAPPSSGAPSGPAPGSTAPAPAPAAQGAAQGAAQTGLNSPQVQQAQKLQQQATQIEMMPGAAFDPRAKAAVADLRARALLLMQADSVTVGPDGVQTHSLTGKQDPAATPLPNYQYDPQQGAYVDTTHTHAATFAPTGRIGKDAFGNSFVTLPGGRTQAIPPVGSRPLTGDYDQQSAAYKADIPVQKDIATAGRVAQATALQLNELADVIKGLKTGGIAPEFRAKAAALLEGAGAQPETIKALTGMSSGSDAQVMQKLAVATLGQAAKTDLGSNVGVESLNLYAQANPGIHLLEDANKRVTNMIRVARAQVDSYSVGAEQHFNTNQTSFLHQGRYDEPLSVFNQKWLQQNNPQIGAAAMGILNGDKYDAWAGRAQPAEAIEATRLAYRIDPNIKVPMPDGSFKPAREVLAGAGSAR